MIPKVDAKNSPPADTLCIENVSLVIRLIAAALIIAAVGIALLAFREYRRQQAADERTYTELIKLLDRAVAARRAIAALEDAEVREQNYVLTGETVYQEGYKRSIGEWKDEVGVLEVQTAKGQLLPLVREVSEAGDRVVSELALIVSLYDGGSREQALERIRKSAAIVYLDEARETMGEIENIDDTDANIAFGKFRHLQPLRRLWISVAGLVCTSLAAAGLLFANSWSFGRQRNG